MEHPITAIKALLNQFEHIADEIAKESGIDHLSGPQGRVLLYIAKHKGEEIYVKDVEQFLKISKSVSSNLVKRMEKNGFISVSSSTSDKRKKIITLTSKGSEKVKPLESFHQRMQEQLFTHISKEDLQVIRRVYLQLAENIARYKERGETHD